jgi:Rrf2 family iron-sulfur cluster assembly transcriptional regulator
MFKQRRKLGFLSEPGYLAVAVLIEIIQQAKEEDREVPIQQIADKVGISHSYTENLATALRHAKIIQTRRGARGGFCSLKSPDQISIAEVITAIYGQNYCGRDIAGTTQETQKLRNSLGNAIYRTLSHVTIADIMLGDFERCPVFEV